MTLRMIDTFSGIGGFSLAARWLGGIETVQFVEREPYCQRILRKHWPTVPIHDDIRTFRPGFKSAEIVCGGFPCQDISNAGRQQGIANGTRSGLFYDLMQVIRQVGPEYVVLENVPAIIANGLNTVLSELAGAGYDAEWGCIKAGDLGACHRRDRWWLVGYRPSTWGRRAKPAAGDAGNAQACTIAADALREQCQGSGAERQPKPDSQCQKEEPLWRSQGFTLSPDWRAYLSEPVLRRGDDGLSSRVDRIRALGNAVVPAVATIPLGRVLRLASLRALKPAGL